MNGPWLEVGYLVFGVGRHGDGRPPTGGLCDLVRALVKDAPQRHKERPVAAGDGQ